jgi:iron-sulfur cluster assembly protein
MGLAILALLVLVQDRYLMLNNSMITLTEQAASKVKEALDRRGRGLGLRLGVRTTGCSGLAYVIEFIDKTNEGDEVFETQGVNVYIDGKSLAYLNGIVLDYQRKGLNEGFEFINPNERDRCGCGESFRV